MDEREGERGATNDVLYLNQMLILYLVMLYQVTKNVSGEKKEKKKKKNKEFEEV